MNMYANMSSQSEYLSFPLVNLVCTLCINMKCFQECHYRVIIL